MLNNQISLEITLGPSDVSILLQFGLILTLFDLLLAVLVSIYEKQLSSALGYKGLVQKFAFYVVFIFLYTLIHLKLHEVGWISTVFFNGVLVCVVLFELASMKRHLIKLGIPPSYLFWVPTDHKQLNKKVKKRADDE